MARLARERECPDPGVSRREQAARERAAQERQERVEGALRRLPVVKAVKGTDKVLSVPLLVAVTHNLLRWIALGA